MVAGSTLHGPQSGVGLRDGHVNVRRVELHHPEATVKVWLDVRARISSQEVRSRHAAHARPSHTDLCAPRLSTESGHCHSKVTDSVTELVTEPLLRNLFSVTLTP
jgi:hypothetical protein